MAAKIFNYYDDWKSVIFTCPTCGWTGTFEEGSVEYYTALKDSSCPACPSAPMLAIVSYPTIEESEANWDKLSDLEKYSVDLDKRFHAAFESSKLTADTELPDLEGSSLILTWDLVAPAPPEGRALTIEERVFGLFTVIRHGDREVWRERACYECAERFVEVLDILKRKYGSRLTDVVPTGASETFLYGDRSSSIGEVEKARASLRG